MYVLYTVLVLLPQYLTISLSALMLHLQNQIFLKGIDPKFYQQNLIFDYISVCLVNLIKAYSKVIKVN